MQKIEETVSEEAEQIKKTLPAGHVIHTMVCEHEVILKFLDKLESLNNRMQKLGNYPENKEDMTELRHIAEHLVEAEAHHSREENVLFPEMEKSGVFGPPNVMRMEHVELRQHKKELKELAENAGEMGFDEFKKSLDRLASFVINTLREHILKENNILYPMALQVITDGSVWDRMKNECDKIGYCCFTPTP